MDRLSRLVSLVEVLAVMVAVSGCGTAAPGVGLAQASTAQSDKPRAEAPPMDVAKVEELVQGNTRFAMELYRQLLDAEANQFLSPYSISLALAMTYAGAEGSTEAAMQEALHYVLGEDTHVAFNALERALADRGEQPDIKEGSRFQLHVANALWGQQNFAFLAAFLDTLALNYGAGMRLVDFVKGPEAARQTINRWVEEQTEERIKDLLPEGSVNGDTRLVLSNAIYFNAAWMNPFEEGMTVDAPFHLIGGSTIDVPMMRQQERLGYAELPGVVAVEVPYVGGDLSMVVLLPAGGQFQPFAAELDEEQLGDILEAIFYTEVQLDLPRFEFESAFELRKSLSALGMAEAFAERADFSGMTGKPELFISDVYHKAFVSVDEEGTEAAAATAVVMALTAAPAQPVQVTVDRPFLFVIRDVPTGAVLFLGHVVDPSA